METQKEIVKNVNIDEQFKREIIDKIDELKILLDTKNKKSVIKDAYKMIIVEGYKELIKSGFKKYVITPENEAVLLNLFQMSKEAIVSYWPIIKELF